MMSGSSGGIGGEGGGGDGGDGQPSRAQASVQLQSAPSTLPLHWVVLPLPHWKTPAHAPVITTEASSSQPNVSIVMSASGEGGLATPTLSVYLTKLQWVDTSTDALIPSYEKTTGIALPALVILFFFLSAFAHTLVCALNFRQAFATGFIEHVFDPERSKTTKWTGWYFVNIHLCQNPLRYVLSL